MGKYQKASNMGVYNVLSDDDDIDESHYTQFLESTVVRRALHVGDQAFGDSSDAVSNHMLRDFMQSARPWVEELLDAGYRVVFYNGQLDLIVAYPLSVNMFSKLRFAAAAQYAVAHRQLWYVDGELAGYVKTAGNMTELLVRDSGHMVPADQPAVAARLIYQATRDTF
ncbi:hypothetical protein PR048_015493 [Dryococelus australis]|uniref:Carboxypeptidase n=1 Tax=Dryococelus australis TaxID=614101 RepID=A0ABQ9HH89_9NEOP|nr:hypothetical protein PR048_015493 [Dryococelus australis]